MKVLKKIVLLGDFGVGKTSLIRKFVDNEFDDRYLSTIGVKISRKEIEIKKYGVSRHASLMIWDIEGKTNIKEINANYLAGASGAIIVADVTRTETMSSLKDHIELFRNNTDKISGKNIVIAINKLDLVEDFDEKALGLDEKVYKVSAKSGLNVEALFEKIGYESIHETIK